MKPSLLPAAFLPLVLLAALPAQITAPTAITPTTSTTTAGAATTAAVSRPIPPAPPAALPVTAYTLNLKWNDSRKDVTLAFQNPTAKPLQIYGVQSSPGLFVADFPKTIPPNGKGDIVVLFDLAPGSQGDMEVVRLKTSDGDKTLHVAHAREPVATLDKTELNWSLNAKAAAQTVTLTLTNGVKVAKVRALLDQTATVAAAGAGQYRITVTPKSTAKPISFPVIVTLDPEIPGVSPVITCTVGLKD